MNLVTLEDAPQSEIEVMQAIANENWTNGVKELQDGGLDIDQFENLAFVSNDTVVVYDKLGNIQAMYYLRFPNELGEEAEDDSSL